MEKMETAKNEHEACCDEQKLVYGPGIMDVKFAPDEALALYALLERRCSEQECGPYSLTHADAVLQRAKMRMANALTLNLRVAAALVGNRRTRPLTKLITAALDEDQRRDGVLASELGKRYLSKQQQKIAGLKDELEDVKAQAAELASERIEVGEPDGFEIVDWDGADQQGDEKPVREYPRRRPPPPVLPSIHGRRARSRRRSRG